MSGTRHHFVPQFIQRGFASHIAGDDAFTWVYRKATKPFNTNVKNVGVEGAFYSDEAGSQVDDQITAAEGRLGSLIAEMRKPADARLPRAVEIAELVAHLEVRSRHLRQNFVQIGSVALDQMLAFIADDQRFIPWAMRSIQRDSRPLLRAIGDDLRRRGLPLSLAPKMLQLSKPLLPRLARSAAKDFALLAENLRSQLPSMVKQAAKNGQLNGLRSNVAPPVKVSTYGKFTYRLHAAEANPLPLGDSMVLFHIAGDRGYRTFTQADEPVLAVLLPLSPRLLLVGSKGNYQPDLSNMPSAIAACSLEHFVADQSSTEFVALQARLGESAAILSRQEIERLLDEAFAELES